MKINWLINIKYDILQVNKQQQYRRKVNLVNLMFDSLIYLINICNDNHLTNKCYDTFRKIIIFIIK